MSEEPSQNNEKINEHNQENKQNSRNLIIKRISDEMKSSYLDYSMSVIAGRALPDIKDGLKPVHRRILFAMYQMGLFHNKPTKKSARVVGEVLGKYHPHGDMAVYDALVRMAQPFSMRYPLIEGQGNFGSIDGDSAAAMRYTEVRLSKIADEMLADIDKETVDFTKNFDNSLYEPLFLPSRIPNLLLNGSSGIAVGMATNIPPHNLNEVADAVISLIDNPEQNSLDLMKFIKGPDFPTGALIYGRQGIMKAYKTGHGKILVRAKTRIEEKNKKNRIIVEEIPYAVNKSEMLEEIVRLVKDKKIDGISNIKDESDKHGVRVVISIKQNFNPSIVLNQLFKHSKLQVTFGIIMLTLIDGKPRVVNLKQILTNFIRHRQNVIRRALEFDLKKSLGRQEIVKGLSIAIDDIDNVVALIKKSKGVNEAKAELINKYSINENQASAILDMKLQKLSSLEREKLENELKELNKKIIDLKDKLGSEQKILEIIKNDMLDIKQKYGDSRRTEIIEGEDANLDIEDLIDDDEVVVVLTNKGYIKRTSLEDYKTQNRGGKGVKAVTTNEEDFVKKVVATTNLSTLLFFTNKGRVYYLKAYRIPEYERASKGKPIINFLPLENDEKIASLIDLKQIRKDSDKVLLFTTRRGIVKRTKLSEFATLRNGVRAISLDGDDSLINVEVSDGTKEVVLATRKGLAARFKETDVRTMGRSARGVIGIRLGENDEVVSSVIVNGEETLLTITERGYGKRTKVKDYRLISRGGKGVINIKINEKNGEVVDVESVKDNDEVIVVTKNGMMIRFPASSVSVFGRNTQGVKIIRIDSDKVVDVGIIRGSGKEDEQ